MSTSRKIVLVGSLALCLILLLAWFVLLSPRMSRAGDLNQQREAVEVQNTATVATIAELEQMKTDIAAKKAEAATLAKRFPSTAAESDLFTLVRHVALQAGIREANVSDLTTGVPALGAADGSVTLPTQPAPTDPNAAPAVGSAPVVAPAGQLGTQSLDVTVTGSRAQVIRFVQALENMDRAYLISNVSIGATGDSAGSTATISGNLYTLPTIVDPTAPQTTPETSTDTGIVTP